MGNGYFRENELKFGLKSNTVIGGKEIDILVFILYHF